MAPMDVHFGQPTILRPVDSGRPLRVNRQFAERVGFTSEELAERPFLEWIHPDDREALERALVAGEASVDARHESRLGSWFPFRWNVKSDGDSTVALGVLHDRFDVVLDDPTPRALSESGTLNGLLVAMARIVEAKNPGMRCSILLVDCSGQRIEGGAGPSLPCAYNEAVEGLRIGPMVGSCGTAAFWNVPVVVENIAEDPLWKDLRDAATLAGVSACWSQPVRDTGGNVLGAMALYNDRPRAPTRAQMDGLEIAAHMVGLAIERHRLEEKLR
jgi:PAS domain S-box-containing protein